MAPSPPRRSSPAHRMTAVPPTPLATLQRAREIGLEAGLHFVYLGNLAPGEGGGDTVCPGCAVPPIRRRGSSGGAVPPRRRVAGGRGGPRAGPRALALPVAGRLARRRRAALGPGGVYRPAADP